MSKTVKLILISGEVNSNKFYNMFENTDSTFTVEYGRVGNSGQKTTKSMSQWDKVYREKTGKGYKDVTDIYILEDKNDDITSTTTVKKTVKDFLISRTQSVIDIVKKLQTWANCSIVENYTVSSENVTQKQIDKAQELLDALSVFTLNDKVLTEFNNKLLEFYSIVPRKMKQVKDHLISIDDDLNVTKNKIISEEQDTLDVMSGQVKLNTNINTVTPDTNLIEETDIIKASGLEIIEVNDNTIIDKIKSMMGSESYMFKQAFEVVNTVTQDKYNTHLNSVLNKKEELFWHGSRNENWWSILTSGLKIRPTNAVHSGSMFGDGIYYASKFKKSYGYTSGRSSYWANGNSNVAILALYNVHVGKQKIITKHNSSCYSLCHSILIKDGFDSVFAQGGIDLVNDEFIVYKSEQSTVKYLIVVEV